MLLAHISTRLWLLQFLHTYFRRKLLQFEWSKTVPNLGMPHFIECEAKDVPSIVIQIKAPFMQRVNALEDFARVLATKK